MKCDVKVINRLKRASGQLEGILRMSEDERTCEDMMTQLAAVRSSIDRIMAMMATTNLLNVLDIALENQSEEVVKALDLIVKHR